MKSFRHMSPYQRATPSGSVPIPPEETPSQISRSNRSARYEAVRTFHEQLVSQREIARRLSLSRNTVRKFLQAETFPERSRPPYRGSILDLYKPYILERWKAGCRFGLDDDGQSPNTQATTFTYGDGSIMTFQVRNLGSFQEADGGNCGNSFFGTKGYYVVEKGFFTYKEGKTSERESIPIPADAPEVEKGSKWQRFFKAVRSRKPQDLPMSPLDAHFSCVHCQLGNISYRLGRSLEFDPQSEHFKDEEANKFIKRDYRKGFEVPQCS